ncbi:MAG: M48 family metalloprotease [Pseudomonadota bacterium]
MKNLTGGALLRLCALVGAVGLVGCQTSDLPLIGGDETTPLLQRVVDDPDGPRLSLAPRNDYPRSIYDIDYNRWVTVVEDDTLRDYVRSVAGKLAAEVPAIGDEAEEIDVFITSHSTAHVSATPSNDILISLDVLQSLENEDQLAFLLAHEIGHIALDHFKRDKVQEAQYKTSEIAKFMGYVGQMLAKSTLQRSAQGGIEVQTDELAYEKSVRKIELVVSALQIAAEGVVDTAWTRRQENDADKLGLDIMAAAGYKTSQIPGAFNILINDKEESSERTKLLVRRLVALAQELSLLSTEEPWRQQFQAFVIEKMGEGTQSMMDSLGKKHQAISKRNETVLAYAATTLQARPGKPTVEPFVAALSNSQSRRIQGVIEESWAASETFLNHVSATVGTTEDDISDDGLDGAISLAKQAVRADGGLSFPRLTSFQMMQQATQLDRAIAELKAVQNSREAGPSVLMHLAVANADAGNEDAAYAAVDRLESQYEPASIFYLRAMVDFTVRDYEAAQLTLAECFSQAERAFALACENVEESFAQQARDDNVEVDSGSKGLFRGIGDTLRQGFQDAGQAFSDIKTGGANSDPVPE